MAKSLPTKIDYCPINDFVVEIRFETSIFANAVFGVIYNSLKGDYPDAETLPILQLPEKLREADPNLKFKAWYKISNSNYSIQVGPNAIVIASAIPYEGWNTFSKRIKKDLSKIIKTNVIKRVTRIGVRVINFFENDIFEKINLDMHLAGRIIAPRDTLVRTKLNADFSFFSTLQIGNNATKGQPGEEITGSIIDIDTYKEYSDNTFLDDYMSEIEKAHNIEKKVFFDLLNEEYLLELGPHYD